jgi:XTP/dITP diphosphohydrolase
MTQQFEGTLNGTILTEKRGAGGFGYDPIFLPDGYNKTLAEMSAEEKNQISHRAKAMEKLMKVLVSFK